MRTPTDRDLVRVWEMGRDKPGWYRGLLMLAPAFPALRFQDMAVWPVGRRNIALYKLRGLLFGSDMTALAKCPHCSALSELPLKLGDICPHEFRLPAAPTAESFVVESELGPLHCRCLTSEDLAAVGRDLRPTNPEMLARALLGGLQLRAPHEGEGHGALREKIADALYEHDPMLELVVSIDCIDCHHEWTTPFDVVGFLWAELVAHATQLLSDVHQLAHAYGWREADILSMSAQRRGFYIERVAHDPVRP